jgi:uncharacterized membrane protein
MAFHVIAGEQNSPAHVEIRTIRLRDLRTALASGWSDFLSLRSDILLVALIYPIVGLGIAVWSSGANVLPLLYPLMSGFALLGPFAAVFFYEISKRREAGLEVSWKKALAVVGSPSMPSIIALGIALALVFLLWLVCAQALYQALFGDNAPTSLPAFVNQVVRTHEGSVMILVGNLIGLVFAAVSFSATVVAFPLLLDRDVGVAVAVSTSVRAVRQNLFVMAVWGVIVAVLLVIGFATIFVGLAIVIPVLGHATWHLYRSLVVRAR